MLGLLVGLHIAPPAASLLFPSVVLTRAPRSSTNNYARPRSSTTTTTPGHNLNNIASEQRRRSLHVLHGSCRGDDTTSTPRIKRSKRFRGVLTELRERKMDEVEDDSMQAQFERELEKDAERWVSGNPGRQELWDKAQARRKYSKSEWDGQGGSCLLRYCCSLYWWSISWSYVCYIMNDRAFYHTYNIMCESQHTSI